MIVSNYAGGLVFYGEKVLVIKNENSEWVLPKGIIHEGDLANEVALQKIKEKTGISASIISSAGETDYEIFSVTRQKPICNKTVWYIMKSYDKNMNTNNNTDDYFQGEFLCIEDAMERVKCKHDKALLNLSFKKYKQLVS